MRRATRLVFLAGALLACGAPAAVADELETVERKICANWKKHKSMTANMTLQSRREKDGAVFAGKGQGTFEALQQGEKTLYRLEVTTEYGRQAGEEEFKLQQHVTVFADGEYQHVLQDSGGRKTAAKARVNPEMSPIPSTVFEWRRRDSELKLLPEETIDGQKVYVIEATLRETGKTGVAKFVYYFLQDSGALLKKVGHNEEGKPTESISYSDFKFDVDLQPEHFVFRAPEGVEVRDQTGVKP